MAAFLEGLRVLDLSAGRAAAITTMCLRDHGAEVLKVERPGGDPLRAHPAFHQWQRGKRSTVLDLADDGDRLRARTLAGEADVVVLDWRPGVAERFGLDHAGLAPDAPALVHCSITGFGRHGPASHVKGYEAVVLAKAGLLWAAAGLTDRDGPSYVATGLASFAAGHAALQGILAALHARSRTGRGQAVQTSLAQALSAYDLYDWLTVSTGVAGAAPGRLGVLGMMTAATADGYWLQFANALPKQLAAFLRAIGIDDHDLPSNADGLAAFARLAGAIRSRIGERSLDEWMEVLLADPDIGVEPYRAPSEVLDHPQLRSAGQVVEIEHPELGVLRQLAPLAAFDGDDPQRVAGAGPALGSASPAFTSGPSRPFRAADGGTRPAGGPLAGVTVLELAWYFAAPFGATLLADLGARVIKVESIGGDPHRWQFQPPEFCGIKVLQGKQSIAVDIRSDAGREILHRLAARADLVLRNFRQSSSERLGLDFASLVAHNPRLAYLYAAAYGASGPRAARPAYAPTMSAAGGVHARTLGVERMLDADGNPLGGAGPAEAGRLAAAGFPSGIGDTSAAIGVASGLLLTLLAAERSGSAQLAQTTMLGTNAALIADAVVGPAGAPGIDRPDRELYGTSALHRLYRAGDDEWVFLAAPSAVEWTALCGVVAGLDGDAAGLAADPRFATADDRRTNDLPLAEALMGVFGSRPAREWERCLTAADVACVEVNRATLATFTITDPIIVDNGHVATAEYPGFGRFRRHGSIVTFSDTPTTVGSAPTVGRETRAILSELGYTDAEIDDLRVAGIVACAEDAPR